MLGSITDLLFASAIDIVTWLFSLFPDSELTLPDMSGLGNWLGSMMGPLNPMLPIAEIAETTSIMVFVMIPSVTVFRLVIFVYGKVPVVGG